MGRRVATNRTLSAAQNVRGVVAGGKLPPTTHPATPAVALGLAVGTSHENRRRQASLNFAQKTLGPQMMQHLKTTPALRVLLNNWLSARASGKNHHAETMALAQAVASEVNQPELTARILQELGNQ
jgi:hypothetical protein